MYARLTYKQVWHKLNKLAYTPALIRGKTKPKPSGAGSVLGGGAAERARDDDSKKNRRRERYEVRDDDGGDEGIRAGRARYARPADPAVDAGPPSVRIPIHPNNEQDGVPNGTPSCSWWRRRDSNPRPLGCEPNALPFGPVFGHHVTDEAGTKRYISRVSGRFSSAFLICS